MKRILRIPFGYDVEAGRLVEIKSDMARHFFPVLELRSRCADERNPIVCVECGDPLVVHATPMRDGTDQHTYHFQHKAGTGNQCPLKSEISKVDKNGLREGQEHLLTKIVLSEVLKRLPGWEVMDVDRKFIFSADGSSRAKPDIHAKYRNRDIAIEIQLRSEKISVIQKRYEHYKALGWPLLWLSLSPDDILPDNIDSSISIKQVQKDIAFYNKGNFFIVTTELLRKSLLEENLKVLCRAFKYKEDITDHRSQPEWIAEEVSFDDMSLEPGAAWVYDIPSQIKMRTEAMLSKIEHRLLADENIKRFISVEDFSEHLSRDLTENALLPDSEREEFTRTTVAKFRELRTADLVAFKSKVVGLIAAHASNPKVVTQAIALKKWDEWATKLTKTRADVGIRKMTDLRVIQSLLLIMGYTLSQHNSPEKRSHINALHFFLDAKPSCHTMCANGRIDLPYGAAQQAAIIAAQCSPLSEEIFSSPTINTKRLDVIRSPSGSPFFILKFVEWMLSEPVYIQTPPKQDV